MRTKNTDTVVTVYRLLSNARVSKMKDEEKYAIIKASRTLKKAGADFDDFLKEAQEKLKPENFDLLAEKISSKSEMSEVEKASVEKYNRDVAACLEDELKKEVELSFEPLSEEALERFYASNDFSISEMLIISEVLGE